MCKVLYILEVKEKAVKRSRGHRVVRYIHHYSQWKPGFLNKSGDSLSYQDNLEMRNWRERFRESSNMEQSTVVISYN